jgi:hypothetical protein
MMAEGSIGAGALGAACGMVVVYGGYLFGRAAVRTRRQLRLNAGTPSDRRVRRTNVRQVLGYVAMVAVSNLLLPVETGVRVLLAVVALLVAPLILAVRFEPAKKRPGSHPKR